MSYLDRIRECNRFDGRNFLPLAVGDIPEVGAVRHDRAELLVDLGAPVEVRADGLVLRGDDLAQRTRAFEACCDLLIDAGAAAERRGERFSVVADDHGEPIAELDRGFVSWFGLRAFGVHMNGFVRHEGGALAMWVATRAFDKRSFAGMLDNLVAGGQPAGISVTDNLYKECREEASIPIELARSARPVGAVSYCVEHESGLKPDTMFCFDLEVPASFVPTPGDDEVERFELMPLEDVAAIVRDSRRFKHNCNLVIIDFLVRHGVLTPEDPDYVAIVRGLSQPFRGLGRS